MHADDQSARARPARRAAKTTFLSATSSLAVASLLGFASVAQAGPFESFSCQSGDRLTNVAFLDQQGGWGNAQRLVDGNQYYGWDTNNPSPSQSRFALGGDGTLGEVALWVASAQGAGSAITVEALRPDGSVAGTAAVPLTASGWQRAPLTAAGVDRMRLKRDGYENAFEVAACEGGGGSTLSVADVSVTEGGTASFVVTMTPPAQAVTQVPYATLDGTATADTDYVAASGTLTFQVGEGGKAVDVATIDDGDVEGTETFLLSLPGGVTGEAEITDNDAVVGGCTVESDYLANANKQLCEPKAFTEGGAAIGIARNYEAWRGKLSDVGPALSEACKATHDKYFTLGPDGKAYHTWHPPRDGACVFGHEHGMDPAHSDVFALSGGYPPFGYVHEQLPHSENHARHEDHFGHKVFVANDTRRATNNPQDGNGVDPNYKPFDPATGKGPFPSTNLVDETGVTCDWLSKLHQGSFSADALSNHVHEYFLTLRCFDGATKVVEFSVKRMNDWGKHEEVKLDGDVVDTISQLTSDLPKPNGSGTDHVAPGRHAGVSGPGGNREFERRLDTSAPDWSFPSRIGQPELWSGNSDWNQIKIPLASGRQEVLHFAPYYVVKNPARIVRKKGSSFEVLPTVEACYTDTQPRTRLNAPFCAILPAAYPGASWWKTAASPFNGTVRAVNFKRLAVYAQGSVGWFCTDPFGVPTSMQANANCPANTVQQRVTSLPNFASQGLGTIERSEFGYTGTPGNVSSGKWRATHEASDPATYGIGLDARLKPSGWHEGGTYVGASIGFEFIVNSDSDGVRVPN